MTEREWVDDNDDKLATVISESTYQRGQCFHAAIVGMSGLKLRWVADIGQADWSYEAETTLDNSNRM